MLVGGKLSPIDVFVQNNVSGHKGDIKGGYTTAIALVPNLIAGTRLGSPTRASSSMAV